MTHDEELDVGTDMTIRIHELIRKIHAEEEKKHGKIDSFEFSQIAHNSLVLLLGTLMAMSPNHDEILIDTFIHLESIVKKEREKENG